VTGEEGLGRGEKKRSRSFRLERKRGEKAGDPYLFVGCRGEENNKGGECEKKGDSILMCSHDHRKKKKEGEDFARYFRWKSASTGGGKKLRRDQERGAHAFTASCSNWYLKGRGRKKDPSV